MPKAIPEPENLDELMMDNLDSFLITDTSLQTSSPRVADIEAAANRAGMGVDVNMYADAVGIINVRVFVRVLVFAGISFHSFPSWRDGLYTLLLPLFSSANSSSTTSLKSQRQRERAYDTHTIL